MKRWTLRAASTLAALGLLAAQSKVSATTNGPRLLRLHEEPTGVVYLAAAHIRCGSTRADVYEAAQLCLREPLHDACGPNDFANELPARPAYVASFYLERTEVTVAAFAQCVRAGACDPAADPALWSGPSAASLPIAYLDWFQARQYCRFRGGRLPTEREFERAARGPNAKVFPWGNWYDAHAANHGRGGVEESDATDGYFRRAPVGSFPQGATGEGILDLAGNVAEWVASGDVGHSFSSSSGRLSPSVRIARGGGWRSPAAWLRGAARLTLPASSRRGDLGVRCAYDSAPPRSS